jgi:hypothetical protein
LGYVAISVHYRKLPPKSALRTAVPVLIADIADAMRRLEPDPRVRTELEVETEVAFIRRLELLQLPGAKPGLGWIGGSDEFGGWIDPMADAFVEALLEGKASQADGYAEAWVVIVDRVGLVDAKNIAEALTRSSRTVPANWTRLWFMPATDRERVIAIAIPGRASMNE